MEQAEKDKELEQTALSVGGMSCAACVIRVEKALGGLEGEEREKELTLLKKKFVFSVIFGLLIMILSMPHFIPYLNELPHQILFYILFILTTPVQFWAGKQFLTGAWGAARHGSADMNTLIAVGTLVAYLYSSLATFAPAFFHQSGLTPT